MNGQDEPVTPVVTGQGFGAVALPLMLLAGAFVLTIYLTWVAFVALYMLFALGIFAFFAWEMFRGGCW